MISKVLNSKVMQKGAEQFRNNKAGFIAGTTLSSILLKDAIGCVYYVNQSLANESIPEEKRKFVAALDMTNGALMIATQFLTFFTLSNEKFRNNMFDKTFGKIFEDKNLEKIAESSKKVLGEKFNQELFDKAIKSAKSSGAKSLGAIVSLIGATVVAKRMIVPFISTPLAQWVKDNVINKGEKKSDETTSNAQGDTLALNQALDTSKLNNKYLKYN